MSTTIEIILLLNLCKIIIIEEISLNLLMKVTNACSKTVLESLKFLVNVTVIEVKVT